MPKFLSNYVIMPNSTVFHNHIVNIEESGILISITPFCSELAYTQYVANPILVFPEDNIDIILSIFKKSANLADFCEMIRREGFKPVRALTTVGLFELNFVENYLSRLL